MSKVGRTKIYARKARVTDDQWLADLTQEMVTSGHLLSRIPAYKIKHFIKSGSVLIENSKSHADVKCEISIFEIQRWFRRVPVAAAIETFASEEKIWKNTRLPKREIWIFGIEAPYRYRKYGEKILRHVVEKQSETGAFVRCLPKSKDFIKIAIRIGFKVLSKDAKSVVLLWSGASSSLL